MKKRKRNRIGMTFSLWACLLCLVAFAADGADAEKGAVRLELIEEAGTQWSIPADKTKLSVLAVGGGGGGAPGLGNAGGGGGAGGLVYVENYLEKYDAKPGDAIEVKIGLPGPIVSMGQGRRGLPGENTVFGKIAALGGGGGGRGRNEDPVHHAGSGGSAGGGTMADELPKALQPAESGIGIGFGHPGGGTAEGSGAGAGGGGAGGPGTPMGQGGGGIGLQGIPKDMSIDKNTGFVTGPFDANNPAHYTFIFRDRFGPGIGDDGWFAGGGAHNTRHNEDQGGRGGGSLWDGMPHTGGGGGGSQSGYQGGRPGVGGSGVVLIRCEKADGSVEVRGWGRVQPDDIVAQRILREPEFLYRGTQYDAAREALAGIENVDALPTSVQVRILRIYGQIYAATGREPEALASFKKALELETE